MQELIGHIGATVIGATVILILAVISWRGQNHAISSTQYSAAKEGILDFAEVIEEDLSNMGAGRTNASLKNNFGGFADASSFDLSSTPNEFRFFSWSDRGMDDDYTDPDDANVIRYQWEPTGSAQVFNPTTQAFESKTTYMILRAVKTGAAGSFVDAGSSIDTLTEITFDFLDDAGNSVDVEANPPQMRDVRAIDVTLKAVSPLGGGTGYVDANDPAQRGEIEETRWTRRIRPTNLSRASL